jgi:hypothetical protein
MASKSNEGCGGTKGVKEEARDADADNKKDIM